MMVKRVIQVRQAQYPALKIYLCGGSVQMQMQGWLPAFVKLPEIPEKLHPARMEMQARMSCLPDLYVALLVRRDGAASVW